MTATRIEPTGSVRQAEYPAMPKTTTFAAITGREPMRTPYTIHTREADAWTKRKFLDPLNK